MSGLPESGHGWAIYEYTSVIIITRCRWRAALPWSGVLAGMASLRPDWFSGSAHGLAVPHHSRRSAAVRRIYIRRLAPRG